MRKIRSFVRRGGRLSDAQQRGLDNPLFMIPVTDHALDLGQIYHNDRPVILEIGFGMGHSLLAQAEAQPDLNFLGIEVHQAGIGSVISGIQAKQLTNIRLIDHDAVEIIKTHLQDDSLQGVQIYFPDPWPKKRHHKRRLVQSSFIELLKPKLRANGFIHCATDWQAYAEDMLSAFQQADWLANQSASQTYIERPDSRPLTKFEQRGLGLGHGIWDLWFNKR